MLIPGPVVVTALVMSVPLLILGFKYLDERRDRICAEEERAEMQQQLDDWKRLHGLTLCKLNQLQSDAANRLKDRYDEVLYNEAMRSLCLRFGIPLMVDEDLDTKLPDDDGKLVKKMEELNELIIRLAEEGGKSRMSEADEKRFTERVEALSVLISCKAIRAHNLRFFQANWIKSGETIAN